MTMRINYLNLLLLFLLGSTPFSLYASGDSLKVRGVTLYTPYTKISVPPGESIDYSVDVINKTRSVKNAAIAVRGLPKGWGYEIKSGGWTVNQLSVLPNDQKNFSLKVDVPLQVNKGTYRFYVSADGMYTLPLTVVVSQKGTYQTEFTTDQINMEGSAEATFTFNATLKNRTAEKQLYALTANAPRGWNVAFKPNYKQATSVEVEPNASTNVTIDINPPANIKVGTYRIPVRAANGTTSADLGLEVVIKGSYKMELTTPNGLLSTDVTAGDTRKIELVVNNSGTIDLTDIQLSAAKPADWDVTFQPQKITSLKAGEKAQVLAVVKASKKAIPGDYVVKMETRTPEVNSAAEFRIAVKTPIIWGWLGILIIIGACGGVYYLFRKYGRR
ncbi:NEW3 domain-containing protein [Bacteroides graminisolvens]|uniref:COG1470 family protein n=1 Tax=Bacteroides graminisolvens TaxID=477666 RepID=UPI0029C82342|nr:NEW3 domain-containing protein [Bacteroides graminisolvens]